MTGKVLEQCPKCSNKVTDQLECKTCGLVFEKYFQAEARRKARDEQVMMSTGSGNYRTLISFGLFIVSALVAAWLFLGREHDVPCQAKDQALAGNDRNTGEKTGQPLTVTQVETNGPGKVNSGSIQRALKSTVSVHTSWGSIGSGFFIGEHEVITNKHVITFNDAKFNDIKNIMDRNRKMLDSQIAQLNEWKRKLEQMPPGASRNHLELLIQSREEAVNKQSAIQKNDEERIARLEDQKAFERITIVMGDNQEYRVDNVIPSPNHDLALLKVSSVSGQALKRRVADQRLDQGQVVYTIGSPMGLNNTVTSGVFSAYRKDVNNDDIYLQVDAAINPGNSGGPLIDGEGNVLGVNTMILSNAQGVGFAIPIDVVFTDFSGEL